MCERLLRQSVCLHSQSPPQKLCVDDESLDSLVLVRTGAAINEGASQPRRQTRVFSLVFSSLLESTIILIVNPDHTEGTILFNQLTSHLVLNLYLYTSGFLRVSLYKTAQFSLNKFRETILLTQLAPLTYDSLKKSTSQFSSH